MNATPHLWSVLAQAAPLADIGGWIVKILAFMLMLVILVFVHELGHFLAAIAMGIKVEEFGIGIPPRAVTLFTHNGVKYTLNWLPLGGFVRFSGDDDSVYGTGSLAEAKPWKKIPVMLAGPLMNLVLAIVIFAMMFAFWGVRAPTGNQRISDVFPNTPAAEAGFQPDDVILSFNGQPVPESAMVLDIAREHDGEAIPVVVVRDNQEMTLMVTPGRWVNDDGRVFESGLGFQYGNELEYVPMGLLEATAGGFVAAFDTTANLIIGIGAMIGGAIGVHEPPPGGLAGPIGIARATGEIIDQGNLYLFLSWMAVFSVNLFILNLLPIPALDGSHILFSLIEWLRGGKKVPPEKEAMVHAIGFASLMALMLLISVSDIINAVRGVPVLGGG
ncbi:MAG: site-2 protease family protein [Chloroflexaceae bacterium]|nr:site-2 protease family protein [Chloroflexaceae bacterium]